MDLVAGVARRMGFPPERIEDIKTAVAEATINAIEHGNELDGSRTVLIGLAPVDRALEIRVRDSARQPPAVEPSEPLFPDLTAKVEGRESARGWGMFLIRSLTDEVEFSSTNRGNVMRMVVRLAV
jgi:serine/threonine-protein kinase RsbW